MTVSNGPFIKNSGLSFCLDLDNNKSWKGKPTTNVVSADITTGNYTFENTCTSVATGEYYNGIPVYRVTFPSGTLPRFYFNFAYTAGQQWNGSIYYRFISGNESNPGIFFREAGFGTSYTSLTFGYTKQWTQASINYTFSGSGTCMFLVYRSNSATTTNVVIDIAMPMCEQSAFATPFVSGTRSSTQAFSDLTGNESITATSMTYAANNLATFNGSSNYIALATSIDCYNKDFTLEAWIRRSVTGAAHGIIGDPQFAWFMFYVNASNKLCCQHKHYNPVSDTVNSVTGATTLNATTWYHVVAAFKKNVGYKLYVNGVIDGSNVDGNAFALTETSRGPINIGRADSSTFGTSPNWFNGTIEMLRGYSNTCLTEYEVRENFNSSRSRFGL